MGELVMRKSSIGLTKSLWNDDKRYIDNYWSVIKDYWVHGDLASRDADGHWYLHGRSDDTIKVSGKRIGPSELESVIVKSGKAKEVAAVGIPDANKGSKIILSIVPAENNDQKESFFEDFNQNTNQNILILNSKKDWLFTFEKNTENQFDLSALKKLKDFNKYTLKKNEDIYSIYSKDILEEKNDAIKQLTFENIYSIESGGLQFISNFLIDSKKLETISKNFFNLKSYKDKSTFLYAKVDIKDENSNKIGYLPDLEDLNFLIKNILKISNEEYLEIIRQSIPEKNPILYTKTSLKIL